MKGEEIAARALACVGARFRPQGRWAETGLDCVGLVAVAIGAVRVRSDYAIRGGTLAALEGELKRAGLVAVPLEAAIGDVLVMQAGPGQLHLGVRTAAGLVHADAGLRRVVERPGEPPWSVLGAWRSSGEAF